MGILNLNLTPIRTCAVVSLVCSIWNLFGDVCFIDFAIAHMSDEGFGTINPTCQSNSNYLFDFIHQSWPVKLAQAGGWMYPLWAISTIFPLYLGLEPASGEGVATLPCLLLLYGLCVVGGNLHAGFAFATILPLVLHSRDVDDEDDVAESSSSGDPYHYSIISSAQSQVIDCYTFGYTPGPIAVIIASGWILHIVVTKETNFPKWFAFCTPLVTLTWVVLVGFFLMPMPLGFYFVGSFGTWIFLVMNTASSWILWNAKSKITLQIVSDK